MGERICCIDGCDRLLIPPYGRGMCSLHYQRWRKHGDPYYTRQRTVRSCAVDGCTDDASKRGWCLKHYTRWRRHGDPAVRMSGEIVDGNKICSRCKIDKPLAEFSRRDAECWCKSCCADKMRERRRLNPKPRVPTTPRECDFCGELFPANKRRSRFCTRACMKAHTYLHWQTKDHKRRERMQQAGFEVFDRREIFERDNWTCGICGEPIDRTLAHPDPMSASLDHVVPIVAGGGHTRANTQASHLICNLKKWATVA